MAEWGTDSDVRYVLYVFIIHTCRVGLVINNSVRKMGLSTIRIEYQNLVPPTWWLYIGAATSRRADRTH